MATFKEWRNAFRSAYSQLNYYQFCDRAGFTPDDYAEEKWGEWLMLCQSLAKFDDATLARILFGATAEVTA